MNDVAPDLKSIFGQAAEIESPTERAAYLDEACGQDAGLRSEVERLLAAAEQAGSFMREPAVARSDTELFCRCLGTPGTVIGPYKLLEQIGEGGLGVVFLAEQTEPVRRTVALKIIKPGMDTRAGDRPLRGRAAGAGDDGPSEHRQGARRGARPDNGRPYFVMELVQGVPITEYCDQCNLTTRERLELFVTGLPGGAARPPEGHHPPRHQADQRAGGRCRTASPCPKIIDFGVAKAIGQQLTEHTLTTAFAQIVGTPLYMSPEQAELSPLGVDTRSDIYSLGVLLYELLTGTTPFDKDRLHAASYDELRRIIREEEPPRPSAAHQHARRRPGHHGRRAPSHRRAPPQPTQSAASSTGS